MKPSARCARDSAARNPLARDREEGRSSIRALLDANVLISAAIRPGGPPGRIVNALLSRQAFELILSPAIIAEVETGLTRTKVRKYLRAPDEALSWLADLVVLAAAVEGRADAIVSGDGDLLVLGEHRGIPILTPRAFLESIDEPA